MILERSVQAQFLIPMAMSLGVGILGATVIVLVGVPAGTKLLDQVLGVTGLQHIEDDEAYTLGSQE